MYSTYVHNNNVKVKVLDYFIFVTHTLWFLTVLKILIVTEDIKAIRKRALFDKH